MSIDLKLKGNNSSKLYSILGGCLASLFVLVLMFCFYGTNGIYPFGTKTISWCDMTQQGVPLLNDFKDIISGKDGLFLNMHNAGGMNFFGVFFFYLASPFTFLSLFVSKAKMLCFASLLVALKMATAAFCAYIYFNYANKRLSPSVKVLLSVMYPFCGYAMQFFQNCIWLDMMYLFPLLLLSLKKLKEEKSAVMYTIVVSLMVVVNFYISYMVVVYIVLFSLIYLLFNIRNKNNKYYSTNLLLGSVMGVVMTAVVWVPSFMQYMSSARGGTTIVESLYEKDLYTVYSTVWTVLIAIAFPIAVIIAELLGGIGGSIKSRIKEDLCLLVLLLIPAVVEPINIMWHTGNYMSFPHRFGFMTTFMMLKIAADIMEERDYKGYKLTNGSEKEVIRGIVTTAVIFLVLIVSVLFVGGYFRNLYNAKGDVLSVYTVTLWGDDNSFKNLLICFTLALILYGIIYMTFRHAKITKSIFILLVAVLFVAEANLNLNVYMGYPAEHYKGSDESFSQYCNLADKINDDTFYRVKSGEKKHGSNIIGACGYNSLDHYTSLTDGDYLYTMRNLGYSGTWMEIFGVGGTNLTNALFSVKYEINSTASGVESVYDDGSNNIKKLPVSLPFGQIYSKNTMAFCQIPENNNRIEAQHILSRSVLGEDVVEDYAPAQQLTRADKYILNEGSIIDYNVELGGNKTLYLDAYDGASTELRDSIDDLFSVYINDAFLCEYPTGDKNGILKLGDYNLGDDSETVRVQLRVKKSVKCASLGVFSIDNDKLSSLISDKKGANLTSKGGRISGTYTAGDNEECFVTLPYKQGYKVKVNGRKVKYQRAVNDFMVFELEKGENRIEITYTPPGFIVGLLFSIIGIALFIVYKLKKDKIKNLYKYNFVLNYLWIGAGVVAIVAIYIVPTVIRMLKVE